MSFANINRKDQGFTIVELLIVVVVIAILAAITIVSYNGITTRANSAAAKASAATAQKKLELYASDSTAGTYPTTWAALSADSSKSYFLPSNGLTFKTSAPNSTDSTNTIQYLICGRASSGTSPVAAPANLAGVTGGVITGAQVVYFDAATGTTGTVGLGSSSGTVVVGSTTYNIACYSPAS